MGFGTVRSDSQIRIAVGQLPRPMGRRHDSGDPLRYPVIIVVAENIKGNTGPCQQLLCSTGLGEVGDPCSKSFLFSTFCRGVTGGARTNQLAMGIVFPDPCVQDVLISGVVGGGIAFGGAGQFQHIGFIHKFYGVNIHSMTMAERKNLLCLGQIQWAAIRVIAGTVADGNQ